MTTPRKASHIFGPGQLDAMPNIATPTPSNFDDVQDFSLSFKRDLKALQGRGQFSADVQSGASTISWKATLATLSGRQMGDLIMGAAANRTTKLNKALFEPHTLVTDGGNARTFVINNKLGTFVRDLGVRDPLTNLPLIRVASSTVIANANQYALASPTSAAPGKYWFHSSRVADQMLISYEWAGNPDTLGSVVPVANQPQGNVGDFKMLQVYEWRDEQNLIELNSALTSDFEISTKTGDYGKPTISGMAQPDPYGNVGTFSFAQTR